MSLPSQGVFCNMLKIYSSSLAKVNIRSGQSGFYHFSKRATDDGININSSSMKI
jgi:hypothetical protein